MNLKLINKLSLLIALLFSSQLALAQISYQGSVPTEITMRNPSSSSNSYIHFGLSKVSGRAAGGISIGSRTDFNERFWLFHNYYENNSLQRRLHISWGGTKLMTIRHNGKVGIGTDNPLAKLSVNGDIRATEIKVKTNIAVPDYVFEPDYQLPTLEETSAYIKANKHLPEIPSAKEMEANGMDLGELNLRLLKKIEELTLHTINQEETIKAQQEGMKLLKDALQQLQEEVAAMKQQSGNE